MKIRHLLLGLAIVALMASCGKKAEPTETPTETPVETATTTPTETPAETVAEQPAETPAPAQKTAKTTKATKKAKTTKETKETAKVDPCEAKVKAFEKYVDELTAAKKNMKSGADALKAYTTLKKAAAAKEATVQECLSNKEYTTRVKNAILAEKQAR
jgi:uncharacterized protein YkwD